MSRNYTRGPLIVQLLESDFHGYKWNTYAVRSPKNHCLAVVGHIDHATAEQNEGNAQLFAAAPELLEACDVAQRYIGLPADKWKDVDWEPIYAQLRAAITKAEGKA